MVRAGRLLGFLRGMSPSFLPRLSDQLVQFGGVLDALNSGTIDHVGVEFIPWLP